MKLECLKQNDIDILSSIVAIIDKSKTKKSKIANDDRILSANYIFTPKNLMDLHNNSLKGVKWHTDRVHPSDLEAKI